MKRYPVFAVIAAIVALFAIDSGDFKIFYLAGQAALQGASPYSAAGFVSPLYLLIYSAPLALLSYPAAYRVNAFLCAFALLVVFDRLTRGNTINLLILCAAPWLLFVTWCGNIEWLVMLGLFVNPILGVFLLMLKPQLGGLAALLLLWRIWRTSRRSAVLCAAVLAAIYAVSFAVGMRWGATLSGWWNTAVFPLTAIIALPIVIYAVHQRRASVALAIGPALAPYVSLQSWVVLSAWLAQRRGALVAFAALSWLLIAAWRMRI